MMTLCFFCLVAGSSLTNVQFCKNLSMTAKVKKNLESLELLNSSLKWVKTFIYLWKKLQSILVTKQSNLTLKYERPETHSQWI